jgi:nucleotide-binding universal stress UspA family protein
MNLFSSILAPLDGSVTAAKSLGCATWLGSRLDARLHILSATEQTLPARAELARLHVPEEYWPLIELHQAPAYPVEAILAAVARHDVRLVVMTARGQAVEVPAEQFDPLKIVGHVTRSVIEQSPVPVLLLPPAYGERLPWERALVPVSGEPAADDALALAVRLANALGIEVHVAHVADAEAGEEGLAAAARYADQVHHEYPARLDELVSRALPQCAPEECCCIADIALCRGDVTAELLGLIETKQISLLVIGWHGRFMTGHARVLKHLIQVVTCPVLLVKPVPRAPFKLKVGEGIE